MKRSIVPCLGAALAVAFPLASAAAQPLAHHVRGTVASVAGNEVTVTTASGPVVVTLVPKTQFAGVVPASAADITTGTFIGTANVAGSGPAKALEVVVFPKAMAGTGEGDYPWDLPAGGGHMSAMTNGTVAPAKMSTMTNATVTHVDSGAAKTVRLAYKGGTKVVAIPAGVPIVRVVPATRALVVTGAHVVVFPPASAAPFVIIGEKGVVPPM